MHFLHLTSNCDLDNSSSVLHKPRDGFCSFFVLQECTGHINKPHCGFLIWDFCKFFTTRLHGLTTLIWQLISQSKTNFSNILFSTSYTLALTAT